MDGSFVIILKITAFEINFPQFHNKLVGVMHCRPIFFLMKITLYVTAYRLLVRVSNVRTVQPFPLFA